MIMLWCEPGEIGAWIPQRVPLFGVLSDIMIAAVSTDGAARPSGCGLGRHKLRCSQTLSSCSAAISIMNVAAHGTAYARALWDMRREARRSLLSMPPPLSSLRDDATAIPHRTSSTNRRC